VTETVSPLTGLNDTELIAMHKRLDEFVSADAAIIQAHHLVTTEMLRRDIPHGHVDDAWVNAAVLIEKAEVKSPDDISAPAGMEKAWAKTLDQGGTVSVLLTTDGYVLKADPTVSDVHVDAIMGSGKKRPRKVVGPAEKESGFTIPRDVQMAAKRAMKWISEGKAGDGFTSVGRGRARDLANGGSVSRDVLVKMRAYFARHGEQRGDHDALDDGEPTPWRVAWDAWGGDAGRTWVNRVLAPVEKRAIPESITDIHINLENRQHAIDEYLYGPMNPDAPGDYWQRLADVWKVDAEEAASTRCGNCAAFNQKPEILEAIADSISDEGDAVLDAADLGYCELFEFKCAAARSCSAWLTGGPLTKAVDENIDEVELLLTMDQEELSKFSSYAFLAEGVEKRGNPEPLRDYWREGGRGQIDWGAGGDFTACVAAVSNYMDEDEAKGYCAIRHNEVTGMWPGDKRNRANKAVEGLATFTLPDGAKYEFSVPVDSVGLLKPIVKHGSHDQKSHGRRGGGVSPEIAESIIDRVRANGGLSVNMVDGSEPPDGYMVARVGVKAAIVAADDFYDTEKGTAALSSFLKDNKAELTGGDYLGVWHDTDGGKVYLDVSQNVKNERTATRLGQERNQISIWDVVNMKEIPTGGTGEIEKSKRFTGDQIARHIFHDRRRNRQFRGTTMGSVESKAELIQKHGEPGDPGYHTKHPTGRGGGGSKEFRTEDLDAAISHLARGEIVVLESKADAYTMLDKLHDYAQESRKKGEDAGDLDLCRVSVPGTNLFCGDSLGVDRIDMPQLAGKPVPGSQADKMPKDSNGEVNVGDLFREKLTESGVEVTDTEMPAASLKASQAELKGANVAFMMSPEGQKIVGLDDTRIFVSSDGYVIDGHHRWAAQVGLDSSDGSLGDRNMKVTVIDMPISQVLQVTNDFADEIGIAPKAAKAANRIQVFNKHLGAQHDQKTHAGKGGGTVGIKDKPASGDRSPEAVSAATALRDRVLSVEPSITRDMQGIAESVGGELEGLKHRVKTTDSLARKIDQDAVAEFGGDREAAASKVSDAVRYTMIVDDDSYTDGLKTTLDTFEKEGYTVDRVKNFWPVGDPYDGVNIKVSKGGVAVEVQLHTPTSSNVKSTSLHADYDRYRTAKDDSERATYWQRMVETASTIPRPSNYTALLGIGVLVVQTFETASQAGLV
jgi:hypothetical protein